MKRGIAALIVALLVAAAACGKSTDGGDSETHWMASCQTDGDCPATTSCVCGMCSKSCAGAADCLDLSADTSCERSNALSRCGDGAPARICVASCWSEENCPTGFECSANRCAPRSLGAGGGGGGDGTANAGSAGQASGGMPSMSGYCGDGIKQQTEACDDGNDREGDDCTNDCAAARCGDGLVHRNGSGGEVCDDGNASNEDGCTTFCLPASCGDGFVQSAYHEICDDGDANGPPPARCNQQCVLN